MSNGRIFSRFNEPSGFSLQGIDYISLVSAQALDNLESVAERLREMDMVMSWKKEEKQHLKNASTT